MIELTLIVLVALVVATIIDLKSNAIPSVFLTGFLLVVLALRMDNLGFGIMVGVFMFLMYEFDKKMGVADFKIGIIIGLLISTMQGFFYFAILFAFAQVLGAYYVRKVLKKEGAEYPFIVGLLGVYIVMIFAGVVG